MTQSFLFALGLVLTSGVLAVAEEPKTEAPAQRTTTASSSAAASTGPQDAAAAKRLLDLRTVVAKAEGSSLQLTLAGSKLREAMAKRDAAASRRLTHPRAAVRAEYELCAEQAAYVQALHLTRNDAAQAYWDLAYAQGAHAIAIDTQRQLEELLTDIRRLASSGLASQLDVSKLDLQLQDQRRLANQARALRQAASSRLAALLSMGPGAEPLATDADLAPVDLVSAEPAAEELCRQAISARPEMRRVEVLVEGTLRECRQGAGARRIRLPGFDRSAEVCAARARYEQALAQKMLLGDKIGAEVAISRTTVLAALHEISLGKGRIEQASQNLPLVRKRLDVGAAPMQEYLEAVRSLSTAKTARLMAQVAHNKGQYSLWTALGQPAVAPAAAARRDASATSEF